MGRKRRADSHRDGRRERDQDAPPRARLSRRGRIAVVVAGAAATALLLVAPRAWRTFAARDIPRLPELGSQPSTVHAHLREAFDAAAANPSTAAIGSYCLALHADMLAEAERCYASGRAARAVSVGSELLPHSDPERTRGGEDLARDLHLIAPGVPDFAPAWWRLGEAEFKRGRVRCSPPRPGIGPQRRPSRNAGLGTRPRDDAVPYAALGLARVALAEGRTEDAHRLLTTATMVAPRFGLAYRLLAETNEALGRRADAARAGTGRSPAGVCALRRPDDRRARASRTARRFFSGRRRKPTRRPTGHGASIPPAGARVRSRKS